MNRDQLLSRYRTALSRHWRTILDRSGPTPELLDDLAGIADEYATAHAERVTARRELREQASTTLRDDYGHGDGDSTGEPPPVAADTTVTAAAPSPSSVARTRTRTRRSAT